MIIYDYLVVGSGCSGAIAAQRLVDKGVKVTMIDVGFSKASNITVPDGSFTDLRRNDPNQYKYFIGKNAEGVKWGKLGKGEQITPSRKHILEKVDTYIPVESDTFSPLESLGYGGLGIGWGLQCWKYSEKDMAATGMNASAMDKEYERVARYIGISATKDEAFDYTLKGLKNYQPSPKMDRNHAYIKRKYDTRKEQFKNQGFHLGRTPLALITEDYDGRKGYEYKDMDWYSDNGRSAWRPWVTVDKLRNNPNFEYIGGYLVTRFTELRDYTKVTCLNVATHKERTVYCRKLILGTGPMGTARIVLRSFNGHDRKLPILCNPYSYIPCIQPRFVGKEVESNKLGFTQLSLFFDELNNNSGASVASLYSYQSLMLFRIVKQAPLNFADASILMRYLMSGLVIMGVHHPDKQSSLKYLELVESPDNPTRDRLRISYALNPDEQKQVDRREKKLMRSMSKMGTYPLKRINPGFGASIHYAGTLPFSENREEYTLNKSGRLNGTRGVYVADSSGFKYLPAPGLTFSIMANASRVAENVVKGL